MKSSPKPSNKKHISLWAIASVVILVIFVAMIWTTYNRHSSDHVLSGLKTINVYVDPPTPKAFLLGEGSGKGFSDVETTQDPTVAKVYAVSDQDATELIAYYQQMYSSYNWHTDYYYPSPGSKGTDLVGTSGGRNIDVYIGSEPYTPQYPPIALKQIGLTGSTAYVTIVLSEKK